MRCFYHEDREAIGTCKSCGRGLCGGCTVEVPKGLECRGCYESSRSLVKKLNESSGSYWVCMGILFGSWAFEEKSKPIWFLGAILGPACLAYGIYLLVLACKKR